MAVVTTRNFNSRARKFGKPKELANCQKVFTSIENGIVRITIDDIARIELQFSFDEFGEITDKWLANQ